MDHGTSFLEFVGFVAIMAAIIAFSASHIIMWIERFENDKQIKSLEARLGTIAENIDELEQDVEALEKKQEEASPRLS